MNRGALDLGVAQPSLRREWLWAIAFALLFGHGLFANLDQLGIGDWDYFVSHAQVGRTTLVEHGQLPLWSPYHCGGAALFENFQSRVYSPSFLLVLASGSNLGNRLAMLVFLVLGFEGARRFARAAGAGPWAARFVGFAAAGNGAVLSQMAMGHFGEMPYLLWPFWLLSVRTAEDKPFRGALTGGLWLALTYLEAGIYPLVHGVLFAGVWCGVRALRGRTLRPLIALAGVTMASLLLSAYVLVPSAVHMASNPRGTVSPETVPVKALFTMLLSTDFDWARPFRFDEQIWGYHEYAAYVGPVFLIALFACLARIRKQRAIVGWLTGGLVFLGWVLGDFAPFSPWTLGHHLPVLGSMRASGRAIMPMLFCFSMAIALAIGTWRFAPYLVLALALNLAWVTPRALDNVFVLPVKAEREATFTQRAEVQHFRLVAKENLSRMTEDVLSNRGAVRCYEPTRFERGATQRFPHAGEVWLAPAQGQARTHLWSPNRLEIDVSGALTSSAVLVNQNYHSGWVRQDGAPVVAKERIIATPVPAGDGRIVLRFDAPLFKGLCALSLVSLLLLLLAVKREQPR